MTLLTFPKTQSPLVSSSSPQTPAFDSFSSLSSSQLPDPNSQLPAPSSNYNVYVSGFLAG